MDKQTFFNLIDKYQDGTTTASEKALVEEYYRRLEAMGITELSGLEELALKERMYKQIMASSVELVTDLQTVDLQSTETLPSVHRIHFRRSRWWAAAAIIIMLGVGTYVAVFNKKDKQDDIVANDLQKDIPAPDRTKATITLANGKVIYLDSIANGTISTENNITVIKTADGKIIYRGNSNEVVYNTLNNPRGSKVIDMTLSDGSHVWLNAGSSVTYPIAFVGNERKVSISGEAYFEVAHNASKPFFVSKDDVSVQVLGTHFNVNAYDDENDIKVTLLEGSVKVNTQDKLQEKLLKPGEQVIATRKGDLSLSVDVDVEVVMAWRNELFIFKGNKIQEVMRQVACWYDVVVEYDGKISDEDFVGIVSRGANISQVLKIMETTRKLKFEITGKKIMVTSL